MSNKKFIFHIKTYNDLDHMCPLVYYFLNKSERIDILFLTSYDFENDYRIKYFKKNYTNLKTVRVSFLQKLRGKIFLNSYVCHLMRKYLLINNLIRFFLNSCWKNIYLSSDIAALIYEWNFPQVLNFNEGKYLGIPTFSLPHGLNIWNNMDINIPIRDHYLKFGSWPDFSSRNQFDSYIVQSERHRKFLILWGQDPKKVHALGSARFYPDWIKLNLSILQSSQNKNSINEKINDETKYRNKLKVVFFLPHLNCNVNRRSMFNLLSKLSDNESIFMLIKLHTRNQKRFVSSLNKLIDDSIKIKFVTDIDSPLLIEWSDVVIGFGTSIVIEAMIKNKPLIHCQYLHDNSTIFDDSQIVHLSKSDDEVMNYLSELTKNISYSKPNQERLNKFLLREVYNFSQEINIPERYYEFILKYVKNQ